MLVGNTSLQEMEQLLKLGEVSWDQSGGRPWAPLLAKVRAWGPGWAPGVVGVASSPWRDLDFAGEVVGMPTIREAGGLAMSRCDLYQ